MCIRDSHLLRIGPGKNAVGRTGVAQLHRDGQLLPKRTAADVDRVVRPAAPALVSCGNGWSNASRGTGDRMDVIFATPGAHYLFLARHAI